MSLATVLENACPTLAHSWARAANAVYPFAATGFLLTKPDPFANPIGQRSRELAPLLLRAVGGLPHDETALLSALEEFVRVRAMQDLSADVTLQVLFAYKGIVREYLKDTKVPPGECSPEELEALDERSDHFALLAFGMYARQREAFFATRLRDIHRRYSQILRLAQRHGLAQTAIGADAGPDNGNDAPFPRTSFADEPF